MKFLRKIIVKLKRFQRNRWNTLSGGVDLGRHPSWFFRNAIRLDYSTAVRATRISAQKYTAVARHWFIDAYFLCERCENVFCWTAREQRTWFEEYRLQVDSVPHLCRTCRKILRDRLSLRKRYDAEIEQCLDRETSAESKREMIETIDQLEVLSDHELPGNIRLNRRRLRNQLSEDRTI